MNKYITIIFSSLIYCLFLSCSVDETSDNPVNTDQGDVNLLTGFMPLHEDGDVNVVVEIPTGTLEKWEVDKSNGQLQLEFIDNKPRIVNYLGYPGNYGMIPRTLLSKESGGDGDPLDVIVLGPPVQRGSTIKCKIIGVLFLLDRGEQDDKLIAVLADTPLYGINSISELNQNYVGISEILQLWFTNYKGPGKMESKGFGEKDIGMDILGAAIQGYQAVNTIKANQ